MDWRARARTARAQACGPRRRGCDRTRAGARSRTQARPPPTRRKRVRAARMRYRDSTVRLPFSIVPAKAGTHIPRPILMGSQHKRVYARLRRTMRGDDMVSLSQPFEQRRNVDLVGLVVAGERVHHDVDAGAECEFALARLGGD